MSDPAADVVAGHHRLPQAEFGNERGDAAGLGVRVVLRRGIGGVLVRLAEPAQIWYEDLAPAEPGNEVPVVGAVPGPPVAEGSSGEQPARRPAGPLTAAAL
jgi:hypothetical protein